MCHIFFSHSSINVYLGCFHVLAIANHAAVNISLLISDVEYLFICLLAISVSSLEKCFFMFFAHSLIGGFLFYKFYEFLDVSFANIFSYSVHCIFNYCLCYYSSNFSPFVPLSPACPPLT